MVDSEKNKISKIQKQDKYQQQLYGFPPQKNFIWSQSQISLFFWYPNSFQGFIYELLLATSTIQYANDSTYINYYFGNVTIINNNN